MMDYTVIPKEVAQFILDRIDSIAQWEAVLLRQSPDSWWEGKQVTDRLYISEETARRCWTDCAVTVY